MFFVVEVFFGANHRHSSCKVSIHRIERFATNLAGASLISSNLWPFWALRFGHRFRLNMFKRIRTVTPTTWNGLNMFGLNIV